jgi:hypothetical protein
MAKGRFSAGTVSGYKSPSSRRSSSLHSNFREFEKIQNAMKRTHTIHSVAIRESARLFAKKYIEPMQGEVKEYKINPDELCNAPTPDAKFKPRGQFWKTKMAKL